ncbi:MAG: pirin family protein [Planctomycetota bacterium]
MLKLRKSDTRGHTDLGWLDSRHTFSFGNYIDRHNVHFGPLRVLNDDIVAPGGGFPNHPHHDMEILTYVVEGALEHRDSLGNGAVLRAGEFQRMTAGTGITHSEFNPSKTERTRFLQVWLQPWQRGLSPSYDQQPLALAAHSGWALVATPAGASPLGQEPAAPLEIQQDARVYAGRFAAGEHAQIALDAAEGAWLQVIDGSLVVNGEEASGGDGVAITDAELITVVANTDAHALLFVVRPSGSS